MTDKELRKLSRLELLELLLKESSENRKLQAELDKLKSENSIAKTSERLMETAEQFDTSLQNVEGLVAVIQKFFSAENAELSQIVTHTVPENTDNITNAKKKKPSEDADIYRRLMIFFARNMNYLSYLPDNLSEDISRRLAKILTKASAAESDNV